MGLFFFFCLESVTQYDLQDDLMLKYIIQLNNNIYSTVIIVYYNSNFLLFYL